MSQKLSSFTRTLIAALCLLTTTGCAELSPTQQRVLSGGSIGSAVGIGVAVLTGGCLPCGGSVGSLVGSGLGYAYDQLQYKKPEETPKHGT